MIKKIFQTGEHTELHCVIRQTVETVNCVDLKIKFECWLTRASDQRERENFYGWSGQNRPSSQGRPKTKSSAVVQSDIIQWFSCFKACSVHRVYGMSDLSNHSEKYNEKRKICDD